MSGRSRLPWVLGPLLAIAVLIGALVVSTAGSGGSDPGPVASLTASPSPSPTSTLSTQERATMEIEELVEEYAVLTNAAYRDPSIPLTAIDTVAVDPIKGVWTENLSKFRQDGAVMTSGGLTAEGIEVVSLSLEPPLPVAEVKVCFVVEASVMRNGSPEQWNERTLSRYEVAQSQQAPVRWVLVDSVPAQTPEQC
jgi:hypothetical protein